MKIFKLLLILSLFSSLFLYAGKVKFANGEWEPYFSKDAKGGGFVTKIVTEAFKIVGVDVEYVWYPWKRGLFEAKKGNLDGSLGWAKTEERKNDFYYSEEPILINRNVFVFRKDKYFEWSTLKDFKNHMIGGTLGYRYSDEFKRAEESKEIKVERVKSDLLNLKKLLAGRITAFACNQNVAMALIKREFSKKDGVKFVFSTKAIKINSAYLLISKKSENGKKLIEKFNDGLKKLKASGMYLKIVESAK